MNAQTMVRRMQIQAAAASFDKLDQLDSCKTSGEKIALLSQLWLEGFNAGAHKAEEILLR